MGLCLKKQCPSCQRTTTIFLKIRYAKDPPYLRPTSMNSSRASYLGQQDSRGKPEHAEDAIGKKQVLTRHPVKDQFLQSPNTSVRDMIWTTVWRLALPLDRDRSRLQHQQRCPIHSECAALRINRVFAMSALSRHNDSCRNLSLTSLLFVLLVMSPASFTMPSKDSLRVDSELCLQWL